MFPAILYWVGGSVNDRFTDVIIHYNLQDLRLWYEKVQV